jgi:hypothetical protein
MTQTTEKVVIGIGTKRHLVSYIYSQDKVRAMDYTSCVVYDKALTKTSFLYVIIYQTELDDNMFFISVELLKKASLIFFKKYFANFHK